MSTKNNTTLLEARLTIAEATIKQLQEEMAELKSGGYSSVSGPEKAEKQQKERKKREKKERDPDAPKSPWENMISKVSSMLDKEAKEKLKGVGFNHMKVAGYLKGTVSEKLAQSHVDEISQSNVDDAVTYLLAHPDYKSKTDEIRSEKGSVSDGEEKKPRGRPKKEKAEKVDKKIEVVSSSGEDGGDEKAVEWEFAGEQFYRLTKTNAVINTDFEYVGVFDGKKIDRKAEMPASVKKYLEQFE